MSKDIIKNIPTIILNDRIFLPGMKFNIEVITKNFFHTLESIILNTENYDVFIVLRKDSPNYDIKSTVYKRGIIARVLQTTRINNRTTNIAFEAVKTADIEDIKASNDYVEYYESDICASSLKEEISEKEMTPLRMALIEKMDEYLIEMGVESNTNNFYNLPIKELMGHIVSKVSLNKKLVQEILEEDELVSQVKKLLVNLEILISVEQVKADVSRSIDKELKKNQREYLLREQIRIIRKELGEDNLSDDYEKYMQRLESINFPQDIKEKVENEIKKIKSFNSMSPDASMQKNYLDAVFSYPWNESSKDEEDIVKVNNVLENEHFGLTKVKERVLEFLAIKTFKPDITMPIICLVGPPGTGKTSIARSIANALNRKLVRISVGGMKDESEIRGHRRTYLGAMSGRIVKGITQAKVNNPIILFDEIDKLSSSFNGDPASALLEVLDYEQNSSFRDNYLEIPVDLSNVLFITTANTLSTIPLPLLDRIEVIEVNSYTENEKYHIAKEYLYKKQLLRCGIDSNVISITDIALKSLISGYTREAGVRNLERVIAKLLRRGVKHILEKKLNSLAISKRNLKEFLGNPKYVREDLNRINEIGIINGLAWTMVGGCILQIEVNVSKGKGRLELTGQIGDVMKESAIIAKSYIKSLLPKFIDEENYFEKHDVHIHIPEGAVPKDGPSAGITMASAMISAILNKPANADLCMTGEITLRGRVLPIGGLKEKLLAAKISKISTVLVPFGNKKDVEELDKEIIEGLGIHFVKTMDEVLEYVFMD